MIRLVAIPSYDVASLGACLTVPSTMSFSYGFTFSVWLQKSLILSLSNNYYLQKGLIANRPPRITRLSSALYTALHNTSPLANRPALNYRSARRSHSVINRTANTQLIWNKTFQGSVFKTNWSIFLKVNNVVWVALDYKKVLYQKEWKSLIKTFLFVCLSVGKICLTQAKHVLVIKVLKY